MNFKVAAFAALLISGLLLQSCGKKDTGPKTTVEITLLEDKSEMSKWLQEFVEQTTGEKGAVEVVAGGKALTIEIPAAALGEVKAALKTWAGPRASGFGMHAVKRGTPEEAKAVATGTMTIPNHTALPYRDRPGEFSIVNSTSAIEFKEIKTARAISTGAGWGVMIDFTPSGAKKMLAFTTANKNERVALVVNDQISTAPTINEPFSSGCMISGNFTEKEARALSMGFKNPPPSTYKVSPQAKPVP